MFERKMERMSEPTNIASSGCAIDPPTASEKAELQSKFHSNVGSIKPAETHHQTAKVSSSAA